MGLELSANYLPRDFWLLGLLCMRFWVAFSLGTTLFALGITSVSSIPFSFFLVWTPVTNFNGITCGSLSICDI